MPRVRKLVYIAGPFRGATTWDIAQNVRAAEALGLEVALKGYMPVIPHANTQLFHGQGTDKFWLEGTLLLLSKCDVLLTLPNWKQSSGARAEVRFAEKHEILVYHSLDDMHKDLQAQLQNELEFFKRPLEVCPRCSKKKVNTKAKWVENNIKYAGSKCSACGHAQGVYMMGRADKPKRKQVVKP